MVERFLRWLKSIRKLGKHTENLNRMRTNLYVMIAISATCEASILLTNIDFFHSNS